MNHTSFSYLPNQIYYPLIGIHFLRPAALCTVRAGGGDLDFVSLHGGFVFAPTAPACRLRYRVKCSAAAALLLGRGEGVISH